MRRALRHFPLLVDLTKREFRLRYLGSILGSYWNLIHPIIMIFIYTVIFSQVMRARLGDHSSRFAYSIYLCSGLLAWNFFSEVINRSHGTILENAAFLKKMTFPPYVLFGAAYASSAINFAISSGIFVVILLAISSLSIAKLFIFFIVAALFGVFALGLGLALGCLNVFVRDIQQITAIVLQLWFWFTPVVYVEEGLPEAIKSLLLFNPAYPFISSLHKLIFYNQWPTNIYFFLMIFWTSISMCFGWLTYKRSISLVRDHL